MSEYALVFGLDQSHPVACDIAAACAPRVPLFISRWSDWRITVSVPRSLSSLRSIREAINVPLTQVRGVLMFDEPALPLVSDQDAGFVRAEFEALLFALCTFITPGFAARWALRLGGYTDVSIQFDHALHHPSITPNVIRRLRTCGDCEALVLGDFFAVRRIDGSVQVERIGDDRSAGGLPIWFQVNAHRTAFTPVVGKFPMWAAARKDLIRAALDEVHWKSAAVPHIDNRGYRAPQVVHQSDLLVTADVYDDEVRHVMYRAKRLQLRASFISTRVGSERPDPTMDAADIIGSADRTVRVYSRTLARPDSAITVSDAAQRARLLRALQGREGVTVNRPMSGFTNWAKVVQLWQLQAAGHDVPLTIVTTDATAAAAFVASVDAVVYKSSSAWRSIVSRFNASDEARLDALVSCPALFQEYIGGPDWRIHNVGGQLFPIRIVSGDTDYRFSRAGFDWALIVPPSRILDLTRASAREMGLLLGGTDFKQHAASGVWYALEVNRAPAFSMFDHLTGNGIADALVMLGGSKGVRS